MTIVAIYLLVCSTFIIGVMGYYQISNFQNAIGYGIGTGNIVYGITILAFILIAIPSLVASLLVFKKSRTSVYITYYSMFALSLLIFLPSAYEFQDFGFLSWNGILLIASLVQLAFVVCMLMGRDAFK